MNKAQRSFLLRFLTVKSTMAKTEGEERAARRLIGMGYVEQRGRFFYATESGIQAARAL